MSSVSLLFKMSHFFFLKKTLKLPKTKNGDVIFTPSPFQLIYVGHGVAVSLTIMKTKVMVMRMLARATTLWSAEMAMVMAVAV